MQITVSLNAKDVIAKLKGVTDNLTEDLRWVSFQTAKYGKSQIAKVVQRDLNASPPVPQRAIKQNIKHDKVGLTSYVLRSSKSPRLPLSLFNPKQDDSGVSFRIDKKEPRTHVPGGFLGPRPGTLAPKLRGEPRIRAADPRLPIRYVGMGPSPWVMFEGCGRVDEVVKLLEKRILKNANERLRARIGGYVR